VTRGDKVTRVMGITAARGSQFGKEGPSLFKARVVIRESSFLGQSTVLKYREIDAAYLKRNLGVVLTLGLLYAAFLLGLAFLRLRRTRDSLLYLRSL
jgi:hypothetical protein